MSYPTGLRVLDGILWGGWHWADFSGRKLTLTYYFDNSFSHWLSEEKSAYRKALGEFARVANISFDETPLKHQANFIEYNVANSFLSSDGIVLGVHEPPEYADVNWADVWQEKGWFNYESWSLPSSGLVYDPSGLRQGGFGFSVLLHELGHALGLGHPHDTSGGVGSLMPGVAFGDSADYGRYSLNQGVYTVMSYNAGWDSMQAPERKSISDYGYNNGLAALDIAAIQYLYGANTSHRSGDTVYKIVDRGAWQSIWDTGGTDIIRYAGSGDVVIDLRSATLDDTSAAGGYLSYVKNTASKGYFGGFTIAGDYTGVVSNSGGERGVIIENARGGSGADRLQGNRVANRLYGDDGDDRLSGGEGNDRLDGGSGRDSLAGGNGNDLLFAGAGADRLIFRKGDDRDIVRRFQDDGDTIVLDDNLWRGDLTRNAVIREFAYIRDGDTVFDFGRDELVIEDFRNVAALANDLEIA